jgi:hypothetical protein
MQSIANGVEMQKSKRGRKTPPLRLAFRFVQAKTAIAFNVKQSISDCAAS